MTAARAGWVDGLAEWIEGDVVSLSVAFTWRVPEAVDRARFYKAAGYKVRAGGPALFLPKLKSLMEDVADLGGAAPDAIARHNPMATIASRGCSVGCWFCIVPKMEGRDFTELPDFPVRPILCDNNLSALSRAYQRHIVGRYISAGVPLLDANSGFEPRTFDDEVLAIWSPINRGPWRFAYDDQADGPHVEKVMSMLRGVSPRRKQVYTLIGNEPFADCMDRIQRVIAWGGEPYAQPVMKLNALERAPIVRHDWTLERLRAVARWVNRRAWRKVGFADYDVSARWRGDGTAPLFDGLA